MRTLHLTALVAALAVGCGEPQPCPSPLEECSGQCVDVQSDRRHCGGCDRACGAGLACVGGTCDSNVNAACHLRTGGAFVTLGHCGDAVKLWIENPDFITEAATASPPPRVPVLSLQDGSDCDGQWSWHADELTASFADAPPNAACNVCPDVIQEDSADGSLAATTWCPGAATVLAVDTR